MSIPKAQWHISLDVTCPKCDEFVDLTSESEFWRWHPEIDRYLNREWVEVKCPLCQYRFGVDCHFQRRGEKDEH